MIPDAYGNLAATPSGRGSRVKQRDETLLQNILGLLEDAGYDVSVIPPRGGPGHEEAPQDDVALEAQLPAEQLMKIPPVLRGATPREGRLCVWQMLGRIGRGVP
jgi:hypothetical protein